MAAVVMSDPSQAVEVLVAAVAPAAVMRRPRQRLNRVPRQVLRLRRLRHPTLVVIESDETPLHSLFTM